jgi:hypothetical protein
MDMEMLFAWAMLYTLGIAVVFYSMGVRAGRKDGYLRGRAAGMRIGQDRRVAK